MQENQRGTRSRLKIAHTGAVDNDESFVRIEGRARQKILPTSGIHNDFFGVLDNVLAGSGVYVSDIASVASE